eukprot:351375-Chlamydomonas_euryale.AAC.21
MSDRAQCARGGMQRSSEVPCPLPLGHRQDRFTMGANLGCVSPWRDVAVSGWPYSGRSPWLPVLQPPEDSQLPACRFDTKRGFWLCSGPHPRGHVKAVRRCSSTLCALELARQGNFPSPDGKAASSARQGNFPSPDGKAASSAHQGNFPSPDGKAASSARPSSHSQRRCSYTDCPAQAAATCCVPRCYSIRYRAMSPTDTMPSTRLVSGWHTTSRRTPGSDSRSTTERSESSCAHSKASRMNPMAGCGLVICLSWASKPLRASSGGQRGMRRDRQSTAQGNATRRCASTWEIAGTLAWPATVV